MDEPLTDTYEYTLCTNLANNTYIVYTLIVLKFNVIHLTVTKDATPISIVAYIYIMVMHVV